MHDTASNSCSGCSYLRVRILSGEATGLLRCCVPSPNDSNVEVIQFQRSSNANYVGWIDIQMYKRGIFTVVAVNAVNIC